MGLNLIFILLTGVIVSTTSSRSTYIIGGVETSVNEFPWQGSLQILSGATYYHVCSVVLYSPNKAVTAAHCLTSTADSYRVAFDIGNMSDPNTVGQVSDITSYINHPDFSGNTAGYPNDIAVLRLATPLDISGPSVSTIPLATGSEDFAGQICTVAGWGRTSLGGGTSDTLNKADMTILNNTDCQTRYIETSGAVINDGHICSLQTGISPCSGDNGSPIVCGGVLAGVTSWTITCSGDFPTVLSRISYFYSWIQGQ